LRLRWDAERSELVSEAAGLAYPLREGVPVLLVREEDAERARQTIEEYKNAATIDDETAEISGEPEAKA